MATKSKHSIEEKLRIGVKSNSKVKSIIPKQKLSILK